MNILIPEDIPSSNKGEVALFEGIYSSLRVWDDFKLSLFSINPNEDEKAYSGKARIIDGRGLIPKHMLDGSGSFLSKVFNYFGFFIRQTLFITGWTLFRSRVLWLFKRDLWKSYLESDLILMCHDSFYAPLYHGPLILVFRMLGKPVILYGSTILPPVRKQPRAVSILRNRLNRFFLQHAHLISVREKLSYDYLDHLKITGKGCVLEYHPDFAFIGASIDENEASAILKDEGVPENVPLVGLAISQRELSYAYPDITDPDIRVEKATHALTKIVDHITGVLGATVIFVPHSIGPTPLVDDRIPADWILDKARHQDKLFNIKTDYSSMQLKGIAGRCLMTLGSRLHFTIDSISMRVPSILITHKGEYRCHGIIGDMAGQKEFVFNIDSFESDRLIALIDTIWNNHTEVCDDLKKRMPGIEQQICQHAFSARRVFQHLTT